MKNCGCWYCEWARGVLERYREMRRPDYVHGDPYQEPEVRQAWDVLCVGEIEIPAPKQSLAIVPYNKAPYANYDTETTEAAA